MEQTRLEGRTNRRQAGQSLTEFVIVLPLLLILVAGLLDLGRLYFAYVAITDASAEGATYGAMYPPDDEKSRKAIETRAQEAAGGLIVLTKKQVDVVGPPEVEDFVRVTVTYSFTLETPLVNAIVPGGVLPLRAVTEEVILEGAID